MIEPITDGIVERLGRLEAANGRLQQECRRWRRGSLAAAAVGVILGITGAGAAARIAPILEANEFVLRDKDGKARFPAPLLRGEGPLEPRALLAWLRATGLAAS